MHTSPEERVVPAASPPPEEHNVPQAPAQAAPPPPATVPRVYQQRAVQSLSSPNRVPDIDEDDYVFEAQGIADFVPQEPIVGDARHPSRTRLFPGGLDFMSSAQIDRKSGRISLTNSKKISTSRKESEKEEAASKSPSESEKSEDEDETVQEMVRTLGEVKIQEEELIDSSESAVIDSLPLFGAVAVGIAAVANGIYRFFGRQDKKERPNDNKS